MVVKLMEILHKGDNTSKDYVLREVLVNPHNIIKCTPDELLSGLHELNPLVSGLDKRQQFTKVLQIGGVTSIVVGSLEQIENKINDQKRLLKG